MLARSGISDGLPAVGSLFVFKSVGSVGCVGHVVSKRLAEGMIENGIVPILDGVCSTDLKSKESFGRCKAFGSKCVICWGAGVKRCGMSAQDIRSPSIAEH